MKENVKGFTESLKNELTVLKKRLDDYGISLRAVAAAANRSPDCASKVFSFQSKNEDIINAAFRLIDEAIDKQTAMAKRLKFQQSRAETEYYTEQSVSFNQNNQKVMEVLNG